MIKFNFTYLKLACAITAIIWILGMILEIPVMRWIGFAAVIIAALVYFIASVLQYRVAYSQAKIEFQNEETPHSFKEMNELAERHSVMDTPINNIFGAIILIGAVIYLNFFRYA